MKLKINILYNVAYQVVGILIPIFTAPYLSRVVGSEGVGLYSYSTSIASCFALFILLGVGDYGARTIARTRDNKELCSKNFLGIYLLQLICAGIVFIVYSIYIYISDDIYYLAFLIQIFYLLSVTLDVNWYFVGTEQFKIAVRRGMIIKLLQVFSIFIFVKSSTDIYKYIFIMTFGVFLGQLMLFPLIFKQLQFVKIGVQDIIKHLKQNLILFIPILATSVFTIMDKIMLEMINHDIAAVGIYEYSEKIVKLPLGIITAVGTVMLPKISNLLATEQESLTESYFNMSMKYLGTLVVAMAFGISGVAPVFSVIFYGEEFLECGNIITMLSVILITISWANIIRTQYLIPKEKNNIYIVAVISGAIINIIFNYLLIPKFGAVGAAIGTVGAEVTVCFIHTVGVWNQLKLKKHLVQWFYYMLCGSLMFIEVRLIGNIMGLSWITLIIQILIGAITYFILLIVLFYCKRDTIFNTLRK